MPRREPASLKHQPATIPPRVSALPSSAAVVSASPATGVLLQRALSDPQRVSPRDYQQLQRAVGNRAVGQLISPIVPPPEKVSAPAIQTKLTVGAAHDRYEQEADRVAAQVLSAPAAHSAGAFGTSGTSGAAITRKPEDKSRAQRMPLAASITPLLKNAARSGFTNKIHRRANADLAGSFDAGQAIENRIAASNLGGSPLPTAMRSFMEPRFGTDFGAVRVHAGSEPARLNRQLGAKAFTQANHIYLGEGTSPGDRGLMAHELTHVVQQGATKPNKLQTKSGLGIQRKFGDMFRRGNKPPKPHKDIPNIVHFIWAGGAKLLPDKNVKVIKSWMVKNPTTQVHLWIDQETAPDGLDLKAHYKQQFSGSKGQPIAVMDIAEQGVQTPHSRYEIDRMRPNYGSSSDLLRYRILHKFGGAYFDSDVEPGEATIKQGIKHAKKQKTGFQVTGYTQGIEAVGNDAYISAKNSPYMKALAETAEKRYESAFSKTEAVDFDDPDYLRAATIWRTGPEASSQMLYDQGLLQSASGVHGKSQVRPVGAKSDVVNEPPSSMTMPRNLVKQQSGEESADSNDRSWLGMPVKATKNIGEAWTIVEKSIKFEVETMGQLRVRTHLSNINDSIKRGTKSTADVPYHQVVTYVFTALRRAKDGGRINFSKIKVSDSPSKIVELGAYLTELLQEKIYKKTPDTDTRPFTPLPYVAVSAMGAGSVAGEDDIHISKGEAFEIVDKGYPANITDPTTDWVACSYQGKPVFIVAYDIKKLAAPGKARTGRVLKRHVKSVK